MTSILMAAAIAGIVSGTEAPNVVRNADAGISDNAQMLGEKHSCKGKNACKGQGGCKTDKHACKGQNACKGQGGCKG
jgi:hypothetical protein